MKYQQRYDTVSNICMVHQTPATTKCITKYKIYKRAKLQLYLSLQLCTRHVMAGDVSWQTNICFLQHDEVEHFGAIRPLWQQS